MFTGVWPVESRYEVVPRKIGDRTIRVVHRCDTEKFRLIEPDSFPGIAWEFSKIENEKQLLAFTHKFGLLGHDRLFKTKCGGDPVEWSLAHARRVAVAFEIIAYIQLDPAQMLAELPALLRSIGWDFTGSATEAEIEASPALQEKLKRLFTPTGKTIRVKDDAGRVKLEKLHVLVPNVRFNADWPSDPLRVAWWVLALLINDEIRGLRVEVSETKLRPVFAFDALLQVIYWRLADELRGSNTRRCIVCGKSFAAKRVDARHCSAKCLMQASRNRNAKKHRRKHGLLSKR